MTIEFICDIIFTRFFGGIKLKEFTILEEKLKDILDEYQLISFDNKELLQAIDNLKSEKEELINTLKNIKG